MLTYYINVKYNNLIKIVLLYMFTSQLYLITILYISDIDYCSSNICANGGTCENGVNTYTCNCATGFTGPNCNTS